MNHFCELAQTIHAIAEYEEQKGGATQRVLDDLDEVETILLDLASSLTEADCL